jgi:hypothetical protein
MFSLRTEGFSRSLDVFYGGVRINKLLFLIKIVLIFFSCKVFCNFWSSKSWITNRIRIDLKCVIRIRTRIKTNGDPQRWLNKYLSKGLAVGYAQAGVHTQWRMNRNNLIKISFVKAHFNDRKIKSV